MFKSSFLNDKSPVIIMKDVDFDNLKCLVEYMYKGEANVPQQMLPSFIQTAESLQIRGDGASKAKLAELNTNTVASSTNNTNNNDESDSDNLKIDEDGDLVKDGRDNKEISKDDIAEVDNENGLDDSEEEIAMGNKEIAERTGQC